MALYTNSSLPPRIALIGSRGSGKTTVGRLLAHRLAWHFVDVDEVIETETKHTIAEFFTQRGEPAFRMLEAEILGRLVGLPQHVVATGGGIVLAKSNRELLKQFGSVVWLMTTPEVAQQRIDFDPRTILSRPQLTPSGGLAEMKLTMKQRELLYREAANLIIDTTHLSPDGVVSAILAAC